MASGNSPLLTPFKMGKFSLSHRVVMPPMTRNRSYNNTPQPHCGEYYLQRTTPGGLIISESTAATDISQRSKDMPGIWTKEQVEAWKPIVEAVHKKGGVFFCQIWHPGRLSIDSTQKWLSVSTFSSRESKNQSNDYAQTWLSVSTFSSREPKDQSNDFAQTWLSDSTISSRKPKNQSNDSAQTWLSVSTFSSREPKDQSNDSAQTWLSASTISSKEHENQSSDSAQTWLSVSTFSSREPKDQNYKYPTPSQPDVYEIDQIVNDFKIAARNAIEAGFDGVEIHAGNDYLIDKNSKNGVSLEKRCRLAIEVTEAVSEEIGAERIGIKFDQFSLNDTIGDSSPEGLGIYFANELSKLGIIYLHVTEPRMVKISDQFRTPSQLLPIRNAFKGTFIASGGYNKFDGDKAIEENYADLVSFGRLFLANPDLPKRFELKTSLNKYERKTFYTQDPIVGYTDYPFLEVAS